MVPPAGYAAPPLLRYFLPVSLAVVLAFVLDLMLGSVVIPPVEILTMLLGGPAQKASWQHILFDFRLPKALTALAAGMGLPVAGLLMQTLFRNPLAGPFVLGISSGASLGVALYLMAGAFIPALFFLPSSSWGLVAAAIAGSALVLLLVLAISLRISESVSLLIIGLMLGSTTGGLVSILQYFTSADQLQSFIIWTFGSLAAVSWPQLAVLLPLTLLGVLLALISRKSLNGLLLGESYAASMGISVRATRLLVITATSLLAGVITAFCGPIAFVGLAIPHLARYFLNTADHRYLLPGAALCGMLAMLIFDIISQLPGRDATLPLNAITALFGAPVVIWVILLNKRMHSFLRR